MVNLVPIKNSKLYKSDSSLANGIAEKAIKSFNASAFDGFPKIEVGLKKSEVLERFGKPIRVSDDGKAFYYENKKFCDLSSFERQCVVYFFNDSKVSSWQKIKIEYTNNLKD